MKKIGEATILIVADVVYFISLPIRLLFFFTSRFNYLEQSSFKKNYFPDFNSVFCSHTFDYSPLRFATDISLYLDKRIFTAYRFSSFA